MKRWTQDQVLGIPVIQSRCRIMPGEQLTIEYGDIYDAVSNPETNKHTCSSELSNETSFSKRKICHCNSKNCKGYLPFDSLI